MTRVAKLLTTAVMSGAVVVSGAQLAGASALPAAQAAQHSAGQHSVGQHSTAQGAKTAAEGAAERAAGPRTKQQNRKRQLNRTKRTGAKVADQKRATYREVLADSKMTDLEDIGPKLETAAKQGLARVTQLSKSLRKAKTPKRAARIVKQLRALKPEELLEMGRVAVAAYYAQENPSAIGDVLDLLEGSPLAGPLAPVIEVIRGIVAKIDETPLGSVVRILDTLLGGLTGLLRNLISKLPLPALSAP